MISIIIPAYNSEMTIRQSLDSCLSQTYTDFEIIVVNDFSSDKTEEIVKDYISKDSRIKLINNAENLGAGLSRRKGLSEIKGELMMFLDADDYIKSDYLETLLGYMNNYGVDIVSSGLILTDYKGNITAQRIPELEYQSGIKRFISNKQDTKRFMNLMLIRSELWKNITYSHRRMNEDTSTLFMLMYFASDILLVPYAGYYYRQNPNSLIHTCNETKRLVYRTLSAKDIQSFLKLQNSNLYSYKSFLNEATILFNSGLQLKEYENEVQEIKDFIKYNI